jgi:hypothetical protein
MAIKSRWPITSTIWAEARFTPKLKSLPTVGRGQLKGVSPAARLPPSGAGSPGESEDFYWWLDGFLAYVGIMAIPLSLEGAAFPALGVGMGVAVAFAAAFAWVVR